MELVVDARCPCHVSSYRRAEKLKHHRTKTYHQQVQTLHFTKPRRGLIARPRTQVHQFLLSMAISISVAESPFERPLLLFPQSFCGLIRRDSNDIVISSHIYKDPPQSISRCCLAQWKAREYAAYARPT